MDKKNSIHPFLYLNLDWIINFEQILHAKIKIWLQMNVN